MHPSFVWNEEIDARPNAPADYHDGTNIKHCHNERVEFTEEEIISMLPPEFKRLGPAEQEPNSGMTKAMFLAERCILVPPSM